MTKRDKRSIEAATPSRGRAARRAADGAFPVIAVGASAGGLEAFATFLEGFAADSGLAIILVQHLDPTHESMMVPLLAGHTKMTVREVSHDTRIERDHVYVIAPGTYLAVRNDALLVSQPKERHGARMPFDFLLRSLAEACGELAIGVVLSGNGKDGSLGLRAIQARGGLVVAQDPTEAAHDGMPRNAITAGVVDLILPVAKMAQSLIAYVNQVRIAPDAEQSAAPIAADSTLSQILDVLRQRAGQDFSAYKPGTLTRRIERRMAIHTIEDRSAYLALLSADTGEIDMLARDLLIHVTSFFRDPAVFEFLAATVVPEIVRGHASGQPLRVWVPACSSGEEVYSLTMIFLEEITAAKKNIKLQIFGSDIDKQAVAAARAGHYPASLEVEISPARLARFFVKDAGSYRIAPLLREAVIFTVQDVLTDPPFSRIDFVSCRNLLIYLLPDAQQRVLGLLHFSLRPSGFMLLGIAESTSPLRDDFEAVSADLRIFRRIGGGRKFSPQFGPVAQSRAFWPRAPRATPARPTDLGEIARRLLLDSFVPASVLVNENYEGLYYFGATEAYLRIPTGDASSGLLAMVHQNLRSKLRGALQRAREGHELTVATATMAKISGDPASVRIEVRTIQGADSELFLVSFVNVPNPAVSGERLAESPEDTPRLVALETVVAELQRELQDAGRELEGSMAEQEAINSEAQSLNEEYQSTNEELETSKEELQSLNEELTALNVQLTATVNHQRSTADDLENILRSSELAIVILDSDLSIRFFSPAGKTLLNGIDADIGRPIGDLAHRFDDSDLTGDIASVLKSLAPLSREIRSHGGEWYTRRILPYRTHSEAAQGVVLTFTNISVMKAAELKIAAERAYAHSVIDTVHQPLVVLDDRLRIVTSNSSFHRAFGVPQTESVGQAFSAIGNGRLNIPAINSFLNRARTELNPIEDFEVETDLAPLGRKVLLFNSRILAGDPTAGRRILLAVEDITERKIISEALEIAKLKAEKANLGKSRFLAAASHDLRQPLQTLSLLHGVLARKMTDAESLGLMRKLDETLGAMSGMLNTLLDINQLEAGAVQPEIEDIAIGPALEHLKTEFSYLAKSKGISLHVVASSLRVRSDPLLLSQMIRNLLSNAVKYTKRGKILIGARRDGENVRLEVWDTGIGIPAGQLAAIFEEYHQLGNPARERSLGLGLGLSIVQRIGELLGHRIEVRSEAGKGAVFIIEVPRGGVAPAKIKPHQLTTRLEKPAGRAGTILIVEDDPSVRDGLELLFDDEGYKAIVASSGEDVLALATSGTFAPDVIVADYNLPGERTGLEVIAHLREMQKREIPAIVLTGDIATEVLRQVLAAKCVCLRKPVNVGELTRSVESLLASAKLRPKAESGRHPTPRAPDTARQTVFLVDDDAILLDGMREMLEQRGHIVESYASAEAFLASYQTGRRGCLVVDGLMPGMDGLELLKLLKAEGRALPSIVVTGHGDIAMAIKAMKAGAIDFLEKPARPEELVASIGRALAQVSDTPERSIARQTAAASLAALTAREREVMNLVVEGQPNKEIAFNLNISQRTVETHRAAVMKRTGSASLPDLIRLVMQAG